jgi:hypothetical protein
MTKQRRKEIFALFRAEKINNVVATFYGGDDEGGPEEVTCYGPDGEVVDFTCWEIFDEILGEIYGGFNNEPIVEGTVEINVAKENITIKASEGYMKYENVKKEL